MHASLVKDVLSQRPLLFKAIVDFNATQQEAGWQADAFLPSVAAESGDAEALAEALWANYACARTALQPIRASVEPFWDFSDEVRRLALLPKPVLLGLATCFGQNIHAREIACTILRDDVLALRALLGDEAYARILFRGQYQLGESVRSFFVGRDMHCDLPARIILHGRQALAACAWTWPEMLRQRVDITSHEGCRQEDVDYLAANRDAMRTVWFSLKKLLFSEVAPTWAPCFD